MDRLEHLAARLVVSSRWLLLAFILGLVVTLALFAAQFLVALARFALAFPAPHKAPVIVAVLDLIDLALIAGLIFTVAVSLFSHYIRRVAVARDDGRRPGWLVTLDAATLKVTVASSIAAISLVHMLQVHLNSERYSAEALTWKVVVHVVLIASAVALAFLDRVSTRRDGVSPPSEAG